MKNSILILTICIVGLTLSANETVNNDNQIGLEAPFRVSANRSERVNRNPHPAPHIEFIPNINGDFVMPLMDSFYDYSPFSYKGHNIQVQPDISQPFGHPAGGRFIGFMAQESEESIRQIFSSYLNNSGELVVSDNITPYIDEREGFSSIAVDKITGQAFASWHIERDSDNLLRCMINNNPYHITGNPNTWSESEVILDIPEFENYHIAWPQIEIGPSPIHDQRRLHFFATTFEANTQGEIDYNSVYGYADFSTVDMNTELALDWNFITFSCMDSYRSNPALVVSEDGKVAIIGTNQEYLYATYSNNYGQDFRCSIQAAMQEIDSPFWQYQDLFLYPSNDSRQFNAAFTNDNSRIVWMGAITLNHAEGMANGTYIPSLFYPKIFSFDINSRSFKFYDIDLQDENPADNNFANPIAYDDNEEPFVMQSYPSWYYEGEYQDSYFIHSRFQISANNNWVLAAWHDDRKLVQAYNEEVGYSTWFQQPEIAYCLSIDGGLTWSDITYMNANPEDIVLNEAENLEGNYYPELGDLTITDISLADKLEIVENTQNNYHAQVGIGFYRDNSYGSYYGSSNAGENLGGTLCYAKLDIEFPAEWNGEMTDSENEEIDAASIKLSNYPNPFNPSTEIRFQISDLSAQNSSVGDQKVELEIYNAKGQKIKSFVCHPELDEGQHKVTWNGTDKQNNLVSSGIYFYTLKQNNRVLASSKMLLIK